MDYEEVYKRAYKIGYVEGVAATKKQAIEVVTNVLWHYPNQLYKDLNKYEVARSVVSDAINNLPSVTPTVSDDRISRQVAMDSIMSEPMNELRYPAWWADKAKSLSGPYKGGDKE